jgi:hypothetical protein
MRQTLTLNKLVQEQGGHMRTITRYFTVLILLMGIIIAPTTTPGQSGNERASESGQQTITGTLIGIGGPLAGRSTSFTLTIKGVTSDQDARRYVGLLADKGQDGLMRAVRDQKLGTFALTGQVGRDVNVVRIHRTETGRKITLLFERWLNLFELRYGTRSEDYPFTYAEIYLDAQGKGEGTLIPAARIRFEKDEQSVEIENFGIYPARLVEIRAR